MTRKLQSSVSTFLKTAKRQTKHCTTCDEPWKSTVREVLEEMANGRVGANVTLAGLTRFLRDPKNFDPPYPLTISALRSHVRQHEAELHQKWVNRGT